MRMTVPILRVKSLGLRSMQNGAQSTDFMTGESGARAGALRQAARARGDEIRFAGVLDLLARTLGAKKREDAGNGRRIAEACEDATNATKRDAREEVRQVHVEHRGPADVGLGIAHDVLTGQKTMGRRLRGELVENVF